MPGRAIALAASCHPGPVVAVTAFVVGLGVAAHVRPSTGAVLGAAVLCGQLSIGWSNDRLDAARDQRVGRPDKPVAAGRVSLRTVEVATAMALLGTVVFSLLLGWRAGLLHLAAVGCGWAYNAVLKATWLSWLPYALAFAALPGIATLAGSPPAAPAAWATVAAGCIGVVAHLANTLPDLDDDRATGIVGLPHRLGARGSVAVALPLLVVGTALAVAGPPGPLRPLGWSALIMTIALAAAAVTQVSRRPRLIFRVLLLLVAVDVVAVLTAGHLH